MIQRLIVVWTLLPAIIMEITDSGNLKPRE
jgi:hypothetical protein